jgi:hypothetical protein
MDLGFGPRLQLDGFQLDRFGLAIFFAGALTAFATTFFAGLDFALAGSLRVIFGIKGIY